MFTICTSKMPESQIVFLVFGMWLLPPVSMIGSPASGSNCPALNGLEAGRSGVVNRSEQKYIHLTQLTDGWCLRCSFFSPKHSNPDYDVRTAGPCKVVFHWRAFVEGYWPCCW